MYRDSRPPGLGALLKSRLSVQRLAKVDVVTKTSMPTPTVVARRDPPGPQPPTGPSAKPTTPVNVKPTPGATPRAKAAPMTYAMAYEQMMRETAAEQQRLLESFKEAFRNSEGFVPFAPIEMRYPKR